MIVCVCHRVSDRDITREAYAGCTSFEQLQDGLRVATGCGRCRECARQTFDAARFAAAPGRTFGERRQLAVCAA